VKFTPTTGSCGAAASTGKPVIVADIENDPLWVGFRDFALANGLKACWSVPIVARGSSTSVDSTSQSPRVLGTFGLYHRQTTRPSQADLEIVSKAAYLAAIAIERELNHRALRESEERLATQSAELFHASRISSLGLMAAAISHEINQPLVAISNYSAACSRLLDNGEPDSQDRLADCFSRMNAAALQAGQIVRRLRSFVRKERRRQGHHNFHQVIHDAIELIGAELRTRQVHVTTNLAKEPALVFADEVQLQQVIVNLLTNAADAMAAQPISSRLIIVDSFIEDNAVQCRITDSGPGFSADVMECVFEPFKTTKPDGSGIGLSICRNIVQDHGGTIDINNSSRGGAMVVIRLPLMDS
jgi:C4-dicarboxylate-specific signal transduction histidine kinase